MPVKHSRDSEAPPNPDPNILDSEDYNAPHKATGGRVGNPIVRTANNDELEPSDHPAVNSIVFPMVDPSGLVNGSFTVVPSGTIGVDRAYTFKIKDTDGAVVSIATFNRPV